MISKQELRDFCHAHKMRKAGIATWSGTSKRTAKQKKLRGKWRSRFWIENNLLPLNTNLI